jgi:hypothetical protein
MKPSFYSQHGFAVDGLPILFRGPTNLPISFPH